MKSLKLRIASAVSAFLICITAFTGCNAVSKGSAKKDPVDAVSNGIEKYADSIISNSETVNAVKKISKSCATYGLEFSVPNGAGIELEAVVDPKKSAYSGEVSVNITRGVHTDLAFWGNEENMAVEFPLLFDDEIYGLNPATFAEDIKSSELFDTEELNEAGAALIDTVSALITGNGAKEYEQFLTNLQSVIDGVEPTVTEESIFISDTDLTAIAVEYELTEDVLIDFRTAGLDLIDGLFGDYLTMILFGRIDSDRTIYDLADEWDDMVYDINNPKTDEHDSPVRGYSALAKILASLQTEGINLKTYMNKKTGALVRLEVSSSDLFEAEATFGAEPDKMLDIEASAELNIEDHYAGAELTVKGIEKNKVEGFEAELTLAVDDNEVTCDLIFERDTEDGDFELEFSTDREDILALEGNLMYDDKSFTISVDSIEIDNKDIDIEFTFFVRSGGTVAEVPKYENILDESVEDLVDIIEDNVREFSEKNRDRF